MEPPSPEDEKGTLSEENPAESYLQEKKGFFRRGKKKKPPRKKDWKWAVGLMGKLLVGVFLLVFLLVLIVFGVLGNLHADWIRDPVLQEVASTAGVELEYETLSVEPFSGIEFRGLMIKNPAPFSDVAPNLIKLDVLQITWDLASAMDGGFKVSGFEIGGLEVALVSDENGDSSITKILEGLPAGEEKEEEEEKPSPPVKLSNVLAFRDMPLFELTAFKFHGFRFEQFELNQGKIAKHTVLEDLGIWADVYAGDGQLEVNFNLGSPKDTEGTSLLVEEYPGTDKEVKRSALVFLRNAVSTPGENGISLAIEVDVKKQNFLDELPESATLLGTTMTVTFHPEENRTRFHLEGLDLVEGASKTTLDVDLMDRADGLVDPKIKKLAGSISADVLLEVLALPLPGMNFNGAGATYELTDVEMNLESGSVHKGSLKFRVNIDKADVLLESQKVDLNSGYFNVEVNFTGPMTLDMDTALKVESAGFGDEAMGLSAGLKDFEFKVVGKQIAVNQENPVATTGALQVNVASKSIEATMGVDEFTISDLALNVDTLLTGSPPYAVNVALPIGKIEAVRDGVPLAQIDQLSVKAGVSGVTETLTEPVKANVEVGVNALSFSEGGMEAQVGEMKVVLDALVRSLASADLNVQFPIGKIRFKDGKGVSAEVDDFAFGVDVKAEEVLPGAPLLSNVDVGLTLDMGRLGAKVPGSRVDLSGMKLGLTTGVEPEQPLNLKLDIPFEKLRVVQNGATLLDTAGAYVNLKVADAQVNMENPAESDATVSWDIALHPLKTAATIVKLGDKAEVDLSLDLAHFGPVAAVLPPSVKREVKIPWKKLKLEIDTSLSMEGLADPAKAFVSQKTSLALKGLSVKTPMVSLKTPKFSMDVKTRGRGQVQKADIALKLSDLSLNGRDYGEPLKIAIHADANPFAPRVDTRLEITAPLGTYINLENALAFKGSSKKISYNNVVEIRDLDFIKANLPPGVVDGIKLDWEAIEIGLKNQGHFRGLIKSMRNFEPKVVGNPLAALTGEHLTEVRIRGIDLEAANNFLQLPALDFSLNLTAEKGELKGGMSMDLPRLFAHPNGSRKPLEVNGLALSSDLHSEGGVENGKVFFKTQMLLKELIHNKVEGYDIRDLAFKLDAVVDQLNRLTLNEFLFRNPAGGTELSLSGLVDGLDPNKVIIDEFGIPGRQNVALEGKLEQDLGLVKINADSMNTSGRISLPFKLSSGDMKVFRFVGEMAADALTVELPDDGIALVGFNGRIPLVEDIALGEEGVRILPGPSKNLYSRKQFSDVQPFLKTDNFISVERIEFMGQTMAPVAGNLRVERDLFAMDQLQIGFRGGNIFGQVVVDYEDGAPKVFFKGNVTGIRPSESKEVLDANATLSLEPTTLKLDGRIQVVRIGRQHLLDMIDVIDPYREDVNMNRARMGLEVGYPKFMRMRMQHGFLAVKLELGGAGSAIRLDEIKGIALGPFLNTYVAPALAGGDGT